VAEEILRRHDVRVTPKKRNPTRRNVI